MSLNSMDRVGENGSMMVKTASISWTPSPYLGNKCSKNLHWWMFCIYVFKDNLLVLSIVGFVDPSPFHPSKGLIFFQRCEASLRSRCSTNWIYNPSWEICISHKQN